MLVIACFESIFEFDFMISSFENRCENSRRKEGKIDNKTKRKFRILELEIRTDIWWRWK